MQLKLGCFLVNLIEGTPFGIPFFHFPLEIGQEFMFASCTHLSLKRIGVMLINMLVKQTVNTVISVPRKFYNLIVCHCHLL